LTGLGVVGLSDKGRSLLPLSDGVLVATAFATAVAGLVAAAVAWVSGATRVPGGARRGVILGAGASAVVLCLIAAGSLSGAASGAQAADLDRETAAAMRDYPGWNGAGPLGGATVTASEVDPASPLGRRLLRPYDAAFRLVLFSIDNRAGSRDVVVDVENARLLAGEGRSVTAVAPGDLARHVVDRSAADTIARRSAVSVPRGQRFDGVQAIFPAEASLRDVRGIEVSVDGAARTVPGRYFTLDDKRAIDASRRGAASAR
jgi:hypothetical protein